MPIQFQCPSCRQPIEVDDEVGGKSAACPYCQRVISVPLQSDYVPEVVVTARALPPAAPGTERPAQPPAVPYRDFQRESQPTYGPPPPMPDLHVGPHPGRMMEAAAIHGKRALICTGIVIALIAVQVALATMVYFSQFGIPSPTSQPTLKDYNEAMLNSRYASVMMAANFGALFFAIAGFAFGIASLRSKRQNNWRGWAATVLCGGTLLCVCGGSVLTAARGLAGVALGAAGWHG